MRGEDRRVLRTGCAGLVALFDVCTGARGCRPLVRVLLLARHIQRCTVEASAVQHQRRLRCGRLLEVDSGGLLDGIVFDGSDLSAEPSEADMPKVKIFEVGQSGSCSREELMEMLVGGCRGEIRDLWVVVSRPLIIWRTMGGSLVWSR